MTRHGIRMLVLVMIVGVLVPLAACKKKPVVTPAPAPAPAPPVVTQQPPPAPPQQPPPQPPAVPPAPRQPTDQELFDRKSVNDLNAERPLADVLFAYDKSDLSDTARTTLTKNGDWLRRWSSTKVTVEGHADSRGTNEYNLALGERRAIAVKEYLITLGIAPARIATVSKGEEQPACREETEACWARNRRAMFEITAK